MAVGPSEICEDLEKKKAEEKAKKEQEKKHEAIRQELLKQRTLATKVLEKYIDSYIKKHPMDYDDKSRMSIKWPSSSTTKEIDWQELKINGIDDLRTFADMRQLAEKYKDAGWDNFKCPTGSLYIELHKY